MKSCVDNKVLGFQQNLIAAWTDYVAGRIDAKALKGASAGFGIYQQRNGATMMRVRRVGGTITTRDLRTAADLLRTYGGDFAHLTTRQDIQLHGIPAGQVTAALAACEANALPFRGGGGDTFRNTLVGAYSGLHADSAFDVLPFAEALSRAFYSYDLAYGLPRKLKIAFADRPSAAYLAQTNDLGFVAKIVDGARVFETYVGGGIGFQPRVGLKLFDALPAEDCIRVAMALTELFNEKGCRTNRSHARIRFLREDLGDAEFVKALTTKLALLPTEAPRAEVAADARRELPVTAFPANDRSGEGFETWSQLAVTPLAGGRVAVRIFVPFGDFTAEQLEAFADAMEANGAVQFQGLDSGDLGLVVPYDQLAGVYNVLAGLKQDFVVRSFVGNIRTCVGCRVCTSGVTDAPAIGRAVAEHFDRRIRPLDTPQKVALAKLLLNEVRISGCPNSCTAHPLARFGFAGRKSAGADAETAFTVGATNPVRLGAPDATVPPIPADELPSYLEQVLLSVVK